MSTSYAIDCDRCKRYLADVTPPAPPVPVLCPKCVRAVQKSDTEDYPDGYLIGPDPIPPLREPGELPLPDGADR